MAGLLEDCLESGAGKMGISLDRKDLALYRRYFEILIEENARYNLTSLEGEKEVAVKHFLDSLGCVKILELKGKYLVDMGSGAGFPGVPLKIYCRDMDVLLVDSVKKKVNFLNGLIESLGLERTGARWDRAEAMGRAEEFRERAGVVVSRAVAPLNVLAELCLPLVEVGGVFLAMKGPGAGVELPEAQGAINLLGGEVERQESFKLPFFEEERTLVLIRKKRPTPAKYPRREGMPAKRPIIF